MASDIRTLISNMNTGGDFTLIARNPLAQFGTPTRRYIGAELLPNRTVEANSYREEFIRYRSVIANAGTRYSPTQKKGGALTGFMQVTLADSDKAAELTGRDYDALLRVLNAANVTAGGVAGGLNTGNPTMQAVASITNFVNTTINIPLEEWNERARWQAIVDAVVQLRGDNGYTEDVLYSDPAGHRANAGGTWSDPTYQPFNDIYAMANLAASLGYTITRAVTSRNVLSIMGNNPKVQALAGRVVLPVGGGGVALANGRVSLAEIGQLMTLDGLPQPELYDLRYRTESGDARFMADNVYCMFAETGRDPNLDLGDLALYPPEILDRLGNTIGYMAVGRAAGQSDAGRVIRSEFKEDKPPRVWAEGWQTTLPVINAPQAIFVIKAIA